MSLTYLLDQRFDFIHGHMHLRDSQSSAYRSTWKAWCFMVGICATALTCCTPRSAAPEKSHDQIDQTFSKSNLRAVLNGDYPQIIVYGADTEKVLDYEEITSEWARGLRWRSTESRSSAEIEEGEINRSIVRYIGTTASNPHLASIASALPWQIDNDSIYLGAQTVSAEDVVIELGWYPRPDVPALPLRITTGTSDAVIAEHLQQQLSGRSQYRSVADLTLWRDGNRIIMADFDEEWQLDESSLRDLSIATDRNGTSDGLSYSGEWDQHDLATALDKWEMTRSHIQLWYGQDIDATIEVLYYSSAEQKALMTQSMDQCHIRDNVAHTLLTAQTSAQVPPEWITLYMDQSGLLHEDWFEPMSYYLNPAAWNRADHSYTSLDWSLLDWDYERWRSPLEGDSKLLRGALHQALMTWLEKKLGKAEIRRLTAQAISAEMETLYRRFLQEHVPGAQGNPLTDEGRVYGSGFNFAHEGYDIIRGYGGSEATAQLTELADLGARTVAVVPYSYMRSATRADEMPVIYQANAENDMATLHSMAVSQSLGMSVMLKPQIWISGSWPGDVDFTTEEDWKRWFSYYRRWILHYAMLAADHDIEILCIGTEFAQASLKHPERWRSIITDIRRIYPGAITYAANWGEEYENIAWADALDYIGCNAYYPLSESMELSDRELSRQVEEMVDKICNRAEEIGRPLLITEIGYRSIQAPWRQPHDTQLEGETTTADQSKLYDLVSSALKQRPVVRGIYWWKYPSYAGYNRRNGRGFTPYGNMDAAQLRQVLDH